MPGVVNRMQETVSNISVYTALFRLQFDFRIDCFQDSTAYTTQFQLLAIDLDMLSKLIYHKPMCIFSLGRNTRRISDERECMLVTPLGVPIKKGMLF